MAAERVKSKYGVLPDYETALLFDKWHIRGERCISLVLSCILAFGLFIGRVYAEFPLSALATLDTPTIGNPVGLTMATDGNLYGLTGINGQYGYGTIFKIAPSGTVAILGYFDGTNGVYPKGPMLLAEDANLYGAAGAVVFRLTTNGDLSVLTVFSQTNGSAPNIPLAQGKDGNFYGTTQYGLGNYLGTIFKLTSGGEITTLLSLMGTNGEFPTAGLTMGNDGAFYGTTGGRDVSFGVDATIFKITPEGVLTTLVYFDSADDDDVTPGLVLGTDGNLYGMTIYGPTHSSVLFFNMTPFGNITTLARFTNENGPLNLILGKDGNFYATANNPSRVLQMTPSGAVSTIISLPSGAGLLMAGNDGNLYGATGGTGLSTVIYRLVPPPMLQNVAKAGNNVTLTWSAAIGQSYQPQYTANLLSTNWSELGGPITATNLTISVFDAPGADTQRFYRVQLLP